MWDNVKALRRLGSWLYVLVFLLLAAAGVAWLYQSPYFPIKQVKIEGELEHTDTEKLQQIAQQYIRGNIFQADLNGAQAAFAAEPWIADAKIVRQLPDAVVITLTERVPIARWSEERLVDSEGVIFTAQLDENLPQFEGEPGAVKNMTRHLAQFQNELSGQQLAVKQLIYTPRSAWEVVLDNDITVRLGREEENRRLARFVEIWPDLLRDQEAQLDYVDMRYRDGFAVRKRPPAPAQPLPEPVSEGL